MKLVPDMTDLHFAYQDIYRHWHVDSERYTGGDALNTALDEGWAINDVVGFQEIHHMGARGTVIYHFELTRREDEAVTMPVVGNPYVDRLVQLMQFKLVPLAKAG
ncbi:MAG: hypothetical protein GC179_26735 [Anaerolineaceae bacterium]|nr:hypothetical protein [Anaerolineaceae bacterium]